MQRESQFQRVGFMNDPFDGESDGLACEGYAATEIEHVTPTARPVFKPKKPRPRISDNKKLCAYTFSDDEGAALAVVREYVAKENEREVLAAKIANLMAKHGDEVYRQRCRDALARRRDEIGTRQREALERWNPGKQLDRPN